MRDNYNIVDLLNILDNYNATCNTPNVKRRITVNGVDLVNDFKEDRKPKINKKRYTLSNINEEELRQKLKALTEKHKRTKRPIPSDIDRVIINKPCVIILWKDGTKTMAKCEKGDTFDPEKGFAIAVAKYYMGNDGFRQALGSYIWGDKK